MALMKVEPASNSSIKCRRSPSSFLVQTLEPRPRGLA